MLGKLIKYEFKHTTRTMITTFAALVIATLIGSFALYRLNFKTVEDGTFVTTMSIIMVVLYVIVIIGVYCIDFIYLCYHYHKTMYSSQGYLTHTLPVSPASIFGAKILVFFVWMLVSSLLSVFSFLALLQAGTNGDLLKELRNLTWSDFSEDVFSIFGMPAGLLLVLFTVISLLGILLYILWITASMAIGQLFLKNRTVCSILAAFCFYIINQVVNTLTLVASGYSTNALLNGELTSFMHLIFAASITTTLVFIAVLYGICIHINKKKLNLE